MTIRQKTKSISLVPNACKTDVPIYRLLPSSLRHESESTGHRSRASSYLIDQDLRVQCNCGQVTFLSPRFLIFKLETVALIQKVTG